MSLRFGAASSSLSREVKEEQLMFPNFKKLSSGLSTGLNF